MGLNRRISEHSSSNKQQRATAAEEEYLEISS
jgi:hypothetical protein